MIPIITFTYKNNYYIYDSNVNKIIRVTREVFIFVRMYICNKLSDNDIFKDVKYEALKHLMNKGFLQKSRIENIEHPWTMNYTDIIENGISYLILQTTQNCNFKCRYCHFADDNGLTRKTNDSCMPWDIARKAIDFLFKHSADSPEICIGFYGGEPLLNFNIIKKSISYAEALFERHNLTYSITTNGSLLTRDIVDYIVNYRFHLRISFDGPSEIQNKHRMFANNGESTFKTVLNNINYIKEKYPEFFSKYVRFNAVIMPGEDYKTILNYFSSLEIPSSKVKINTANLEGIDYLVLLEGNEFPDKYIEKKGLENLSESKFSNSLSNKSNIKKTMHPNGACLPAHTRLMVSTQGDFYPCEKVPENNCSSKIGNIFTGYDYKSIKSMINIGKLTEEKCKNCWCIRFCMICASRCLSINDSGYSIERKEKACEYYKKTTLYLFKKYIDSLEVL